MVAKIVLKLSTLSLTEKRVGGEVVGKKQSHQHKTCLVVTASYHTYTCFRDVAFLVVCVWSFFLSFWFAFFFFPIIDTSLGLLRALPVSA